MNGCEKSDLAIVATKPTNKAGQTAAEPVERRAGTKGNVGQQSTHRTQSRGRVTQALGRVRQAAKQRKKDRFTGIGFVPPTPDELPRIRTEGTKKSRMVATYERSPDAREECLKHHGRQCTVCGFDFEERYGSIGAGFIHVHHLVPVSAIGEEYEVDPVNDLCPVCPNCHAMLHKRTPPYSVAELMELMGSAPGASTSPPRQRRKLGVTV